MNDDVIDDHQPLDESEPVELSLDELGRAYAKAVGLVTGTAPSVDEKELNELSDQSADDETSCPITPKSILEAILFVGAPDSDEPLTTRQIASWLRDVSPQEIARLAKELNEAYAAEGAAYRIEHNKGQLRLVLTDQFGDIREKFYGEVRKARLSQQAIDVLAIVAYNQPVARQQVDELRGRNCSAILNQLVKRQLLSVEKNDATKLKEYRTTDRFLELFGLNSIDDLPQSEDAMLPELAD